MAGDLKQCRGREALYSQRFCRFDRLDWMDELGGGAVGSIGAPLC
jgi:hypothetical protein